MLNKKKKVNINVGGMESQLWSNKKKSLPSRKKAEVEKNICREQS
jgi:hypothetical protein